MTASQRAISLPTAPALIAAPSPSFVDALHADRPAADGADKMGLYGWPNRTLGDGICRPQ